MDKPIKNKGFSLLEALMATVISLIVLTAIGGLFSSGSISSHKIDYQQRAQQYAAGILSTIVKDLRGSQRIVTTAFATTNPPVFPIPIAYGNSQPGIAFSTQASPVGNIFVYQYNPATRIITFESRRWDNTVLSNTNRFVSDSALRINNFECWFTSTEVAIRIQISDPNNAANPIVTDQAYVAIRYYN